MFPKRLRIRFRAVLVPIDDNVETMSPGKLVAAAEWRRIDL